MKNKEAEKIFVLGGEYLEALNDAIGDTIETHGVPECKQYLDDIIFTAIKLSVSIDRMIKQMLVEGKYEEIRSEMLALLEQGAKRDDE